MRKPFRSPASRLSWLWALLPLLLAAVLAIPLLDVDAFEGDEPASLIAAGILGSGPTIIGGYLDQGKSATGPWLAHAAHRLGASCWLERNRCPGIPTLRRSADSRLGLPHRP